MLIAIKQTPATTPLQDTIRKMWLYPSQESTLPTVDQCSVYAVSLATWLQPRRSCTLIWSHNKIIPKQKLRF
jgi:hypothetical protein